MESPECDVGGQVISCRHPRPEGFNYTRCARSAGAVPDIFTSLLPISTEPEINRMSALRAAASKLFFTPVVFSSVSSSETWVMPCDSNSFSWSELSTTSPDESTKPASKTLEGSRMPYQTVLLCDAVFPAIAGGTELKTIEIKTAGSPNDFLSDIFWCPPVLDAVLVGSLAVDNRAVRLRKPPNGALTIFVAQLFLTVLTRSGGARFCICELSPYEDARAFRSNRLSAYPRPGFTHRIERLRKIAP
jgi:hypothetical protein